MIATVGGRDTAQIDSIPNCSHHCVRSPGSRAGRERAATDVPMKLLFPVLLVAAIVLSASCTVMFYRLRPPSPVDWPTAYPGGASTTFRLTRSGGAAPASGKAAARWKKDERRIASITLKALTKRGCTARQTTGQDEATFATRGRCRPRQ